MDGKKIEEILKEKNTSLNKLANGSNVGYATLHDIMSGKTKNPGIDTVIKIANFLGKKIDDLI